MKSLPELYTLWDNFNTPIDDEDCIELPFLHFEKGTNRQDIWRWFEKQNVDFLCGEVMAGIRR